MNLTALIGWQVYPDNVKGNVKDNVRTARRLDVQGQTMLKHISCVAEADELLAFDRPANLLHLTE